MTLSRILRLLALSAAMVSIGDTAFAQLEPSLATKAPPALESAGVSRRLISIDNVCAWPNLVQLKDGSLVALVFNQPNHGRYEGDVDCWGSADGQFWNRLSTVTRHAPETVRMNHAAGLNAAGDLVVMCNGWDKVNPRRNSESLPIDTVACTSHDGGKTWEQGDSKLPQEPGQSWHVPFGDIHTAANGDLVVGTYTFTPVPLLKPGKETPRGNIYAVRSKDGGKTWTDVTPITKDIHVEAAMLHTGNGHWLAASRRFGKLDLEIFASDDDARTWRSVTLLDVKPVSSAHLLKLSDGRILLTYGNRTNGDRGIDARTSRDGGKTWSDPQRLLALESGDLGYPDAIELPGGRIIVAFYSQGVPAHQRYHMGVVNVTLDELK